MAVKKTDKGWKVDLRPHGAQGPRIRKTFKNKAEAIRFEAFEKNKAIHEPWNPKAKDYRKVSEITELWYETHGKHLNRGHLKKGSTLQFAKSCGDKQARLVTHEDVINFRNKLVKKLKVSTVNNYVTILKGVYNTLIENKLIDYENPIANIKPLKTQEEEKPYLSKEEIGTLLSNLKEMDNDVYHLSLICLSTGARWQEAYNLTDGDIKNNLVQLKETKSKKIRKVKIWPELEAIIKAWIPTKQKSLGYTRNEFHDYSVKLGLKKRENQNTHILRHSFAAHFIINGGHLMTLKEILGHEEIETTMWYAHLGPSYLDEAAELNPIKMDKKWTQKPKNEQQTL